jgi:hypothetical protein
MNVSTLLLLLLLGMALGLEPTVATLESVLAVNGLSKWHALFEKEDITLQNAGDLTDDELMKLGLGLGARKDILKLFAAERPCPYGKYLEDDTCTDIPATHDCPAGEHWAGTGCQPDPRPRACPAGEHWAGTGCQPDPRPRACQYGQYWDGQGCATNLPIQDCEYGSFWTGSYCQKNPPPPERTGHSSCNGRQWWDGRHCVDVKDDL